MGVEKGRLDGYIGLKIRQKAKNRPKLASVLSLL